MNRLLRLSLVALFCAIPAVGVSGQVGVICGESGSSPWLTAPVVYGIVNLNDFDMGRGMPKITVTLTDQNQRALRYNIDRSGYYCFRDVDGSGGTLIVDMEGTEMARGSLPFGGRNLNQYRQDFEINAPRHLRVQRAAVISAKFAYNRGDATRQIFNDAVSAEKQGNGQKALKLFRGVVEVDNADFVAWAKIGNLHFEMKQMAEAETAYKNALIAKPDYPMATMNLGRVYLNQDKVDDAINSLLQTTTAEPTMARGHQLLGEAYLLARKGTLAVAALNEAIRLDPVGMAECHILMARLYERAGLKTSASREYKLFLEKVPNHPDKKKFEKYIKDNPEQ